jgi:hypothetical protein
LDIPSQISRIRDSYIPMERIMKRAEYEDKARSEILTNLNLLSQDSFELIFSLMNTDFWGGKIHTDRFGALSSVPMLNMIRKNDIEKLKIWIIAAYEKEDLTRIDELISGLYGISYGSSSPLDKRTQKQCAE